MSLIIPKKPLTKPNGRETQKVIVLMRDELKEVGVLKINDRSISSCNFKELSLHYFHNFKRDPVVRYRVRKSKSTPEKKYNYSNDKLFIIEKLNSLGEKDSSIYRLNLKELVILHIALTKGSYQKGSKDKYISTLKSAKKYISKLDKARKQNEQRKEYIQKYHDYLRSEQWEAIRDVVIKDRNRKCERCGSKKNLQVHHKTYERIFNEDLSDLELLCRPCHKKEHNITDELQTA